MRTTCALAALLLVGPIWAHAEEPRGHRDAISCNLKALTEAERQEQRQLLARVEEALAQAKELPDGFSFRVTTERLTGQQLMRWIDLERRCCPFLRFVVEIEPDHGPTWLRLTGGPGVKDFPRAEVNPKCSEINWEPSGPSDGY